MDIRPIILVKFLYSSLSGGYRRLYEILKLGKSEGIDYIIITDSESCQNASRIFPGFMDILRNYKVYKIELQRRQVLISGLKQVAKFKRIFHSAAVISKIAQKEDADLIVNPHEGFEGVLTSYLAGKFCSKPWTAVFQPTADLLQPSQSIGSLNLLNALSLVSQKKSTTNLSLLAKVGLSAGLFGLLKVAERSLMLSVSLSASEEVRFLNPKISFQVIKPGNGIDVQKFAKGQAPNPKYSAIFLVG